MSVLQGLEGNADLIPALFGPDWVMRVYHDIPPDDKLSRQLIETVQDLYEHVDFCYVREIKQFENLSGKHFLFKCFGDFLLHNLFKITDQFPRLRLSERTTPFFCVKNKAVQFAYNCFLVTVS
jgi:hypothetical protein